MSQRGMNWVFQLECDSTRYLTISLKGWPDSLSAHSTRFTVLWTNTRVDQYIKFYWDRQFYLLLKPIVGVRMRFVGIETGQAMSAPPTPSHLRPTACDYQSLFS